MPLLQVHLVYSAEWQTTSYFEAHEIVVEQNLKVCQLAAHDLNELQSVMTTEIDCVSWGCQRKHGKKIVPRLHCRYL